MAGDRGVDTKTEPQLSIYNSTVSVPRLQDSCQLRKGQTFPMALSVEGFLLWLIMGREGYSSIRNTTWIRTAWKSTGKAADKMCSSDKWSFNSSPATLFPLLCPWAYSSFLSCQSQTSPTYKSLAVYLNFNSSTGLYIFTSDWILHRLQLQPAINDVFI